MKTFINEVAPGMGTQRSFLKSKPGVFNGFAPILNFAEKEIYVSIPQIWGIGRFRPAHYGSLAGMDSIDKFIVEANVITTQANKYNSPEYVEPIKEYMRCLKTPANPGIKKDELFEKGKASFTQNCLKCHDLQDGSSSDAFEFKVLGSPLVFKNLLEDYSPPDFQSKKAYKAFKKAGILYSMADQIRARRLNGIWTRKNFSTNGSLNALEELFCLNGFKRTNPNPQDPLTDGVHMDLCEKYSNDEKLALIEYLNFK